MEWWVIGLIAALVIQFSFIAWFAWKTGDTSPSRENRLRDDPSRASWTSSAMQNDMQGGE